MNTVNKMNTVKKAKVKKGKWNVSGVRLDLIINTFRMPESIQVRSKITKEHNYQFNFKNR